MLICFTATFSPLLNCLSSFWDEIRRIRIVKNSKRISFFVLLTGHLPKTAATYCNDNRECYNRLSV